MLLHVVKETDAGIVVRGAKYETAAAYANQAFTKPTIANWGNSALSDYARWIHLRPGLAQPQIHLPHGIRGARAGRGLSARQQIRRGRRAGDFRRRADPLGERAVLSAHQGGGVHPRDAASLLGVCLRAAQSEARRHDDRRGAVQRAADRTRQAAGGAGEARATGRVSRGHQRAPDGGDRARGEEPGGAADAESIAALHRPGARLLAAARDDAHRARAVRRTDLRHAGQGGVRGARDQAVARQVLFGQRELGGRGPAQAAGVRARPAELRLRGSPADVPAVCAVPALRASGRGVPQFRLGRTAGFRAQGRRPVRARCTRRAIARAATGRSTSGSPGRCASQARRRPARRLNMAASAAAAQSAHEDGCSASASCTA